MDVSTVNDVKIYNLSAGKSIPEWISAKSRKKLERKSVDARRRIQLIQDFEMPDVSHSICITPDQRYVFAAGSYKPVLKCYDLTNLSVKFERGLDADVIKMHVLSEDYSKVILLEQDRYIEMHAAFGRYFRMRMPCYGRDMAYSEEASDLYLVGAKKEIYRLNLEQGEWLSPFESTGSSINCCQVSKDHQLFIDGTSSGVVESWDHRDKTLCSTLDCQSILANYLGDQVHAEITSLAFGGPLHIGVGTSTGHVLLFDIRSRRPLLVKDHNNELPVKKIEFIKRDDGDLIASMDQRMLKMWNQNDGSALAAIENQYELNDFCRFPDSGLFLFANETQKMLQYFVPNIGPAPKWCSYLESLTEELEETESTVYDNYKFVTKKQLEELGLSGLEGTSVLRAYMHGYFIDARLYAKAQTQTQPLAYENYKDNKIKSLVDEEREQKAIEKKKKKLPSVNASMAARLQEEASLEQKKAENKREKKQKKKSAIASEILGDDRFKKLFEDEEFEVDEHSEMFERNASMFKRNAGKATVEVDDEDSAPDDTSDEDEAPPASGSDEDEPGLAQGRVWEEKDQNPDINSDINSDDSESEDEDAKKKKAKEKERRLMDKMKRRTEGLQERSAFHKARKEERAALKPAKFVLHTLGAGEKTNKFIDEKMVVENNAKEESMALGARKKFVQRKEGRKAVEIAESTPFGGRQMTFKIEKRAKDQRIEKEKEKKEAHVKERKEATRRPNHLVTKGLKKLPGNLNVGGRPAWKY